MKITFSKIVNDIANTAMTVALSLPKNQEFEVPNLFNDNIWNYFRKSLGTNIGRKFNKLVHEQFPTHFNDLGKNTKTGNQRYEKL